MQLVVFIEVVAIVLVSESKLYVYLYFSVKSTKTGLITTQCVATTVKVVTV